MNLADRDYRFLIRTLDSPDTDAERFRQIAQDAASVGLVGWQCGAGVIAVDGYCKVGDMDLRNDGSVGRDWRFCLVSELDENQDFPKLDNEAVEKERTFLEARGIQLLSIEAMIRPARAGTAIPRPSSHWNSFPSHFEAAIEYISIPPENWKEYQEFMRDKFGPVGKGLVEEGHSYSVTITELVHSYFRDPTLPGWNRIHILTGDFDPKTGGFLRQTAAMVRRVVGATHSIESALGLASYRRKPRMSRNRLVLTSRAPSETHPADAA